MNPVSLFSGSGDKCNERQATLWKYANLEQQAPEPEIPVYDCRYCDRQTHDSSKICPDCHHEGMGMGR